MDAPRHYDPERGRAVHEMPLEHLVTYTIVFNLTHKPARSEITAVDLQRALVNAQAPIRPMEGVLIHLGMGSKYATWNSLGLAGF